MPSIRVPLTFLAEGGDAGRDGKPRRMGGNPSKRLQRFALRAKVRGWAERRRRGLVCSLAFAAAWMPAATAGEGPVAAPLELSHCAVCHGVELRGNALLDAPNLSVLPPWYVQRQLEGYKSGQRAPADSPDLPGREMQPMAAALDADGIRAAVAYVDDVPEYRPPPTVQGDAARGEGLYRTCIACHGERGQGNESLSSPPLAGQSDWYLVRQMENYRSGVRGSVPGDLWGIQMRAAAAVLQSDADVRDLVAYINSWNPTP